MKQDKLFDCVFIATDSNNVQKVRYANDINKRRKILQRDKFTIQYERSFDRKLTKLEIIDILQNDDDDAVSNALDIVFREERKILRKTEKTTVDDIFKAILSRKEDTQTDMSVA